MTRILFYHLLFLFSTTIYAQNADINLLKNINQNETSFKNGYLNFCASSTAALSIASPASVFAEGLIRKDKNLQRDGLFMAGGLFVANATTYSLKRVFNRKRPFERYSFIVKRDNEPSGHSMPSGHATAAFYTATSLSMHYKKWYVTVPAFIYAGSVAWARMYQGVHYPSDVLAGAVIGSGTALLMDVVKRKTAKKKKPVAAVD